MSTSLPYKKGSHVVICQVTGKAVYAEDAARRYDGVICARTDLDQQHPQELRRARPERPAQQPLSGDPPDVFKADYINRPEDL